MFYQANYKYQYPIRLLYGFLNIDGNNLQIPVAFPALTEWGELIPDEDHKINAGLQIEMELGWLAIKSRKTYYFRSPLNLPEEVIKSDLFTIIIGLGDQGEVAVWLHHELKNSLIFYTHGLDISEKMSDEMIVRANILGKDGEKIESIKALCLNDEKLFNLPHSNEIIADCIENRMKRFTYRYRMMFEVEPLEYTIKESLFDGCFDKISDKDIFQYHEAAKPYRLAIGWISEDEHSSKDEYNAYIWIEEPYISKIFDRFYGTHPETKTDFIIRIDAENKKYELALYRQGLKEPVVIPESAYQLIVFKNKFEDYRSENYNQPRGAWIW